MIREDRQLSSFDGAAVELEPCQSLRAMTLRDLMEDTDAFGEVVDAGHGSW